MFRNISILVVFQTNIFCQTIVFISSEEATPYLKSYEVAIQELTFLANVIQDSLDKKANEYYNDVIYSGCWHGVEDTTRRYLRIQKFEKLTQDFENLHESLLYIFDSTYQFLFMKIEFEYLEFINCFADTNKFTVILEKDRMAFVADIVDYTEEFIQFVTCYYESNNISYGNIYIPPPRGLAYATSKKMIKAHFTF